MTRQKKLNIINKAGYSVIDFDGWNVTKNGRLLFKDLITIEKAIDAAWKHLFEEN